MWGNNKRKIQNYIHITLYSRVDYIKNGGVVGVWIWLCIFAPLLDVVRMCDCIIKDEVYTLFILSLMSEFELVPVSMLCNE